VSSKREENVTFLYLIILDLTGLYWLIITAKNLKNSYIYERFPSIEGTFQNQPEIQHDGSGGQQPIN
jgi:hypothetical protein